MTEDEVVAFAVANVELEGLEIDDELKELIRKIYRADLTVEDALLLRRIKEKLSDEEG